MHITCEKCSTTYVLDDALIPPQGVPVQCTRCAHVFTARVPTAAAPPPAKAAAPGNSTMMFGSPAAPPADAPKNTTMMFGTAASNAPPPPQAPAAPPSARTTMMFGGGATPAPPAPAQPSARSTMVFGTAASNAPPAAAPQAPANARTTMMFGAGAQPAPAAPAAPAKNTTMMFGTPASNAASQAAQSAPPPAAAANKTLVFGGAPAAPAAPAKNTTMMFGTPASNAASQAPAAPVPAARTTQMFGEPATDGSEETIMDNGPGQSNRTLMFGAPDEAAPAAPAKNTTMMFGRSPIPKVTAGTVELAGYAAEEGQQNESTVRVDAAQVVEEHGSDEPSPPPRQERTQRFAMSDVGGSGLSTPPAGGGAVQDRHNRTQLFAMRGSENVTPSGGTAPAEISADMTLPPGAVSVDNLGGVDLHRTLPPDGQFDPPGVSLLSDASGLTPPESAAAPMEPGAVTLQNLTPLNDAPRLAPLRLELPPEPGLDSELLSAPVDAAQAAREDAEAMRAVRGGGAGRVVVIILVLIALGLAGVLVWRLFGKDLLGQRVPAEAILSTERALATLRLDDEQAQAKAVSELSAVTAQHPELFEAQAALVLALAVQFDDAQGVLARGEERLSKLKKNDEGGQAAIDALQKELIGQTEIAQKLKAQLNGEHQKLLAMGAELDRASPSQLAFIRADGVALGVQGNVEAITRAEGFRQRTGQVDDWAELIEPEFALNGGTSFDEAVKRVERVQAREGNSTFIRPYVLLARLELKRGNEAQAVEQLDRAVTLNGKHGIARDMLAALKR